MMFLLAGLILTRAMAPGDATVKLVGKIDGQDIGTTVYTRTMQPDHSWIEVLDSKLEGNGSSLKSDMKVHFSAQGLCMEEDEKEIVNDEVKRDATVKFSSSGAVVTDKVSGKTTTYNAPSSPPTLDPSDLWWVKTKPKIGDKGIASSFSIDDGWRTTTVTYVEDRLYKLGDKTIHAHLIRHENPKDTHDEIVDDEGMPLDIEVPGANGLHFVRTPYTDL
jgi:hypothetical protein